jgi:hypothetical protein
MDFGAGLLSSGLVAGPVKRPSMKRPDVGFRSFDKAHFFVEGKVGFAFRVERDTRRAWIRPCSVFDGIDKLTSQAAALSVGANADHPKIMGNVARVGRFTRLVVAVEPCHGILPKSPLDPSMRFGELARRWDLQGWTNHSDPKKLFGIIHSDQRNIAHKAALDEEADQFPELVIIFWIAFANHVARDRIVTERCAKDIYSRVLMPAIEIMQAHRIDGPQIDTDFQRIS